MTLQNIIKDIFKFLFYTSFYSWVWLTLEMKTAVNNRQKDQYGELYSKCIQLNINRKTLPRE